MVYESRIGKKTSIRILASGKFLRGFFPDEKKPDPHPASVQVLTGFLGHPVVTPHGQQAERPVVDLHGHSASQRHPVAPCGRPTPFARTAGNPPAAFRGRLTPSPAPRGNSKPSPSGAQDPRPLPAVLLNRRRPCVFKAAGVRLQKEHSMNSVSLLGYLTSDVELRYTPTGSPVANFGIAVNRRYRQDDEVKQGNDLRRPRGFQSHRGSGEGVSRQGPSGGDRGPVAVSGLGRPRPAPSVPSWRCWSTGCTCCRATARTATASNNGCQ